MIIDRRTFERRYIRNSNITLKQYRQWRITLSCNCDYEGCQGWGAVPRDKHLIKDHKLLYAPHIGDAKGVRVWNGIRWINP